MDHVNIFQILEQCDRRSFFLTIDSCHPLYHLASKSKDTYQLRAQSLPDKIAI